MNKLYPTDHKKRVVPLSSEIKKEEPYRTCWRRDYARLIHSAAFRRLQGKTQLFPGRESDFFRNRLTHSLEVAQIAKSIALRINYENSFFKNAPIHTDIVEVASLAHDLGHPPFGHNGEAALDACMLNYGGFEGNAQTLRILAKLEKRENKTTLGQKEAPAIIAGVDNRAGLNLAYRTLASVVKYDHAIPKRRKKGSEVTKGYYYTEKTLVADIKARFGVSKGAKLSTIECSIMDIADDIAYSTYDLEDAFKAGFLTPCKMLARGLDMAFASRIAVQVNKRLKKMKPKLQKVIPNLSDDQLSVDRGEVFLILTSVLKDILTLNEGALTSSVLKDIFALDESPPVNDDIFFKKFETFVSFISGSVTGASDDLAAQGGLRTNFTSDQVGRYIRSIKVCYEKNAPFLSFVYMDLDILKELEILKIFTYESLIMSPMLKVTEYRGKDIVTEIFEALTSDDGHLLMPNDFQKLYFELRDKAEKKRVVCDFIAGMTDRYAVQFYGRLFGTNPETIFSPL